ncbi:unnamed protein product [Miscanthus lutarioriparius]|uniref:Uncharacterized protein n=1 Tax=Miscanthus lutarioriparius TaxID=422564 RepID=A0A811NU05_9POAL|nr:unnamed protein product [Miscanthus lutarioriparius]
MARFWAHFVDNKLLKPFWLAHWTEGKAQKALVEEAKQSLALLEAQLDGKSVLEEVNGVTVVDEDEYPALRRWSKEYNSCEALKQCVPDRDRLVVYFTENKEKYKTLSNARLQQ